MPKLRSLSILQMQDYTHLSPLDLSNLTSLTIESYIITFDELKKFLRKIRSQLKGLHIFNYTEDLDYLDAQRREDYLSEKELVQILKIKLFCDVLTSVPFHVNWSTSSAHRSWN